jgi:hypothetical protein
MTLPVTGGLPSDVEGNDGAVYNLELNKRENFPASLKAKWLVTIHNVLVWIENQF